MTWRIDFHPEVETDVSEAGAWYEEKQEGLGAEFVREVIQVFNALVENPLLVSRRHPTKNIRWRYTKRFPFRVVYKIVEPLGTIIVGAVLHAARDDQEWKRRI